MLLLLLGCVSYFAVGGGQLELTLSEPADPEFGDTWTIPGQTEDLGERVLPYGRWQADCRYGDVAWLFQVDDEPEALEACWGELRLVVWLGSDLEVGVAQRGDEVYTELDIILPDGDAGQSRADPGLTLRLEDLTSGELRFEGLPVREGDGTGAGYGEPYRWLDLELSWAFDSNTRVLLGRELDGL
ncbi:MAG: hypothetical protein H6741_31120 [Alphaproteobacteria bacterium]|nr:hypothetical protein [Alphaproteobacteria bacterium]MCB9797161.1 hypothetical protein [Alphaproteobacteria bacterium]